MHAVFVPNIMYMFFLLGNRWRRKYGNVYIPQSDLPLPHKSADLSLVRAGRSYAICPYIRIRFHYCIKCKHSYIFPNIHLFHYISTYIHKQAQTPAPTCTDWDIAFWIGAFVENMTFITTTIFYPSKKVKKNVS